MKVTCLLSILLVIYSIKIQAQEPYKFKKYIGSNVSFYEPWEVAIDSKGNLFVAEGNRTIKKISPTGEVLAIINTNIGFPYNLDNGFASKLALDIEDNLFVTTFQNRVLKFKNDGTFLFEFGKYGSNDGEFDTAIDVTADSEGNIYVLDQRNYRVQKFNKNGVFLSKFQLNVNPSVNFVYPSSIGISPAGNIYIGDGTIGIFKFTKDGSFIGPMSSYLLYSSGNVLIWDISFDKTGNMLTTEWPGEIRKFDSNETLQFTISGFFDRPAGSTFDKNGNIYVADKDHNVIQKFNKNGNFISKTGFHGKGEGMFGTIRGIAVDSRKNLFLATPEYQSISKIDSTGKIIQKIEDLSLGAISDMGIDKKGNIYLTSYSVLVYSNSLQFLKMFNSEQGIQNQASTITVDVDGYIYIGDVANKITKLDSLGNIISKFTYAIPGKILCLRSDSKNNLYILDDTQTIYKLNSNGEFLLKFGSNGVDDGKLSPLTKKFEIDKNDNIWIADGDNYRIQRFNSSGYFLEKFGTKIPKNGGFFGNIYNIGVDKKNNIYVVEQDPNERISVFSNIPEVKPLRNLITGNIFIDNNKNCSRDANEKGYKYGLVLLQPGNIYFGTDSTGKFEIPTDTGTFTISQIIQKTNGLKIEEVCPTTKTAYQVKFTKSDTSASGINFGNYIEYFPFLKVNLAVYNFRRCYVNAGYITYANLGAAPSDFAQIHLQLPEYVTLKETNKPFSKDKDGSYVFDIGILQPNQSGEIRFSDSIACVRNIVGLTECIKVWITPFNQKEVKAGWDKSDILVSGKCENNGFVRMGIYNRGSGNMRDSLEYRIYINAQLALKRKFKLPQNDSLILRIPANGKTIRLESDEPQDHPSKTSANITVENCGIDPNSILYRGYVTKLPQGDTEPEVSVKCQLIIDSYDPNDKQVMPEGTTSQHFTPTNAELQYLIRFQNTGTDTAYTVTVIDTLSENLDIATLQIGSSSHQYKFNVSGKGEPVLTWTFNNINLPDSTKNQAASNGFLSFSIKPKENLPVKTKIENFADIIFDFNDPVRTNITFNTIYDVPADIVQSVKLEEKAIIPVPVITSFSPNKAKVGENITVKGRNFETLLQNNLLKIKDLQVTIQSANDSVLVFKVPNGAVSGKLSLKTSYGFAESNSELIILYPPILTSFSPNRAKVGESVTLKGKYFEKNINDNLVKLNGTQVSIQSGNDSILVFQVPQGATSGKITVQTSVETATSATDFIVLYLPVIASFSPETGIPNDKITISGSGFDVIKSNNTVKFGEIQAEVISASSTKLEVKVPSGFYQAKISVETAGGKSTTSKDFTMLLTPLEKLPDNQIKIYPNPTDGKITLDFSENAFKVKEIKILNVMGSRIYEKKIDSSLEKVEIDLSEKSNGMYILLIKTETGTITKKIILK